MMAFSMGSPASGIFIAYKCYMKVPDLPGRVTEKFPVLYDLHLQQVLHRRTL